MHAAATISPQPAARVFLLRLAAEGPSLAQLFGARHAGLAPVDADNAPPVDLLQVGPAGQDAGALLDAPEAAQAARLRDDGARQAFITAHAALRLLLAHETGDHPASLRFVTGPFGKPRLADPGQGIHFSLARRPGIVALALGTAPLGVDVEPVRQGIDTAGISARFFTAGEHAFVSQAEGRPDSPPRFFGVWARKEALVKAAGVGIDALGEAGALKSQATLANDAGARRRYCVHQLPGGADCALAMAIELPGAPA